MVFTSVDVSMQTREEPNFDRMAGGVQYLFKFKHFYDQMDFSLEQSLAITKSIMRSVTRSKFVMVEKSREKPIDSVTTWSCFMKNEDAISRVATIDHFLLHRV